MIFHLKLQVVFYEHFFLLELINQFGFVFENQHLEALKWFFNGNLSFGRENFQEIFFKRSFCLPLLYMNDISDHKRILFSLHPDIWTQLRSPNKISIW
jgi:hypothetical protein